MASILVADDDAVIQRLLKYILEQDGHTVVIASDGGEALGIVADELFDLLLLDLDMPDWHGLDVLKQARSDERYRDVPVVILTASGQERDAEAAWEAGVNQFLTKPFSSRTLRSTVDGLLGRGTSS